MCLNKPVFTVKLVKIIAITCLILLFIIGIVLIVDPALGLNPLGKYGKAIGGLSQIIHPYLCIVIGCLIIIASLFCVVALMKQSMKWLTFAAIVYLALALLMFLYGLILYILCALGKPHATAALEMSRWKDMKDYRKLQKDLRCCGQFGYQDYDKSKGGVPSVCCQNEECIGTKDEIRYHYWGCEMKVAKLLYILLYTIAIMLMCFAALVLFTAGIVFLLSGLVDPCLCTK